MVQVLVMWFCGAIGTMCSVVFRSARCVSYHRFCFVICGVELCMYHIDFVLLLVYVDCENVITE